MYCLSNILGDDLYPEKPDFEGQHPPMTIPYTVEEARTKYPSHNRNELIRDDSEKVRSSSRCNIKMLDGQVSPIYGAELIMQKRSVL